MSELETAIIYSIKKKMSSEEIMAAYNLSPEQLWNILFNLKGKGYAILKRIYADGRLTYEFNKTVDHNKNYNNSLIMGKKDNTFTAFIIADTHLGGEHESPEMLEALYNLCLKEDVHCIIHCGDFIDSFVNEKATVNNYIERQREQIVKALEVYPYDPHIFTYVCLGNHDLNALQKGNQNLALAFENYRHDLIPIGWNSGIINIKNDQILVGHKVNKKFSVKASERIVILGHQHYMSFNFNKNKVVIQAPALDCYKKPIIKLTLKLERGIFVSGIIEQFSITDHIFNKSNELKFEFDNKKSEPEVGESRKRTL